MTDITPKNRADELLKKEEWMELIDDSIDDTVAAIIQQIKQDRDNAETIYRELLSLYNQGKNNPDDIRELNKAQELLQKTTQQLQKVFDTLAKIKTGESRIQIAQIQAAQDEVKQVFNRQDMIEMMEQLESEIDDDNSDQPQDNIEVDYEVTSNTD